jgi:hypothetical protein
MTKLGECGCSECDLRERRRSFTSTMITCNSVSRRSRSNAVGEASTSGWSMVTARHVQNAEMAAREMGGLSVADALSLCELLANTDPACYERAALRWLQRFIDEGSARAIADAMRTLSRRAGSRKRGAGRGT